MAKKKTKSRLVSATYLLPEDLKDEIKERALEQEVSAGQVLRQLLRKVLPGKSDSETTSKVR